MNLNLTWDLFIVVFFAIVVTYTFIIGKKESVKIIVSSYIGIVAVQGFTNVLARIASYTGPLLGGFGLPVTPTVISMGKLALFIAIIIFLALRSGFEATYPKEPNAVVNALITALFGFATAGLLLSTLLTYVAGVPLLDMSLANAAALSPVIQQSQFMQIMILHQDLWFSLPAVVLIAVGFLHHKE